MIFYIHLFTSNHRISYSRQPLHPESEGSVLLCTEHVLIVEEGGKKGEQKKRKLTRACGAWQHLTQQEVNFITTLLSRQNTQHQTRTALFHGCPAAPKQHMAELVEEWCHGQHNELCSTVLCALCCMGKKIKCDRKAAAEHKDTKFSLTT